MTTTKNVSEIRPGDVLVGSLCDMTALEVRAFPGQGVEVTLAHTEDAKVKSYRWFNRGTTVTVR